MDKNINSESVNRRIIYDELRSKYRNYEIFDLVKNLSRSVPSLDPESLLTHMLNSEGGLLFHVYKLTVDLEKIFSKKNGITEEEKSLAIASVLYHDALKLQIEDDVVRRISQTSTYGHSVGMERVFQYFELPELAQAVRHNPLDFIADYEKGRITVPQLLLNIVDRLNISGSSVTPYDKNHHIESMFGDREDFYRRADVLVTTILDSALKENNFGSLPFITRSLFPVKSSIIIQRFDDKYVEPRGIYIETCSNYHMGRRLATFGYNTEIVHKHEGEIDDAIYNFSNGSVVVHGVDVNNGNLIEEFARLSRGHDYIFIEGWTSLIQPLKEKIGNEKPVFLLMRAMSEGALDERRLSNAIHADEIWVMTPLMKDIITSQLEPLHQAGKKTPAVRILTSGIDEEIFYADEKTARQKGKITYVGGTTKLKGVDELLEAFDIVRKIFPESELHLIGDPGIYGKRNDFDKSRLNREGVVFHGVMKAEDVAEHLRTAHVSVLLTKIFEAYGKAAMQARVCGTPMVVSNRGALTLHVQSDEEGIVLDNIDPDNVADALIKILSREPQTILPPIDRYHTWRRTAVDFSTNLTMYEREKTKIALM
jgi:glycosyltransferase involved in cell wall biosynthesis